MWTQATEAEITTSIKRSTLNKKVINQSGLLSYCIYLLPYQLYAKQNTKYSRAPSNKAGREMGLT
jgi:hypothetical protein